MRKTYLRGLRTNVFLSEAVTLTGSAVCSTYQLCGCSMPSLGVRPSR